MYMWYAWLNMYVQTMHAQMHADILVCAHLYAFFNVNANSVCLKTWNHPHCQSATRAFPWQSPGRSGMEHKRWRLNGLQGWSDMACHCTYIKFSQDARIISKATQQENHANPRSNTRMSQTLCPSFFTGARCTRQGEQAPHPSPLWAVAQ